MANITKNEMHALLLLFKDYDADYNANSLSKELKITPMGALKILKKLAQQKIITPKQMGKAVFYKPNLNYDYSRTLIELLLRGEAEQETEPRIKRWIAELKTLEKNAEIGILFGSVLAKEDYHDVDLLIVLSQKQLSSANKAINEINETTAKKVHAIKQTKEDLTANIKDKVIIQILKTGIVLFGYAELIKVIQNAAQ